MTVMAEFKLDDRTAAVFTVMELFHTPMFLVLVDETGGFRFAGINSAHQKKSGLTSAMLEGKTPDEILPPRLADTINANYARCTTPDADANCTRCTAHLACPACARSVEYEELLELPTGPMWWKTHLSPMSDGNRVIALLGHAYDLTEEKARMEQVTSRLNRVQSSANDLRTLSRASTSHLRGPLHQIISFSELLMPEFKPPMQRKMDLLNGIRDAARNAMEELDQYEEGAGGMLTVAGMQADVDFGHLCRDTAALVDPARDLNISFPCSTINADREALRWVVTKSMEGIAAMVGSEIAISVQPDGMRPHMLKLSISCDLIDPTSHGLSPAEREKLIAGAQVRGVTTDILDRALPGGRRGMKLEFSLSGRVANGTEQALAEAARQVRSGPATD